MSQGRNRSSIRLKSQKIKEEKEERERRIIEKKRKLMTAYINKELFKFRVRNLL